MKLYHGTSARYLPSITKKGLIPRGSKKSNWPTTPSHPGVVYLTNAYAVYFANQALTKKDKKLLVLEVDTKKLHPFTFVPDEDFLAEIFQKSMKNTTPTERSRIFVQQLVQNQALFDSKPIQLSLQHLGTVGYMGHIPKSAITKVALVDVTEAQDYIFQTFDPSVCLLNYQICGQAYRNSLKWLFEEPLEEVPEHSYSFRAPRDRNGIIVLDWTKEEPKNVEEFL